MNRAFLLIALVTISVSFAQQQSIPNAPQSSAVDRSRLPKALANAQLEHFSSGALMLLDHGGDLVRARARSTSTAPMATQEMSSVTLVPRIGPNVRPGNDPYTL